MDFRESNIFCLTECMIRAMIAQHISTQGVVLVSTGSLKVEKLSVVGHHVKSSTLNLNAEDNLALAA